METEGILHAKYDAQQVTASFTKREFVLRIEDNPQYPQFVVFQLTQEKCGFLDSFAPNARVKVAFNLRGREWKSPQGEVKYFNTLEAWSIMPVGIVQSKPYVANENFDKKGVQLDLGNTHLLTKEVENSDDLPF